jgi:hypothetical protein
MNKISWLVFFTLGSILVLPSAFSGVGRVGNFTVGSHELGFYIHHPNSYMAWSATTESVYLKSVVPNFGGSTKQLPSINIALFSVRYPTLTNLNRDEVQNWFKENGWQHTKEPQNCIDKFKTDSNTIYIWGEGLGFIMTGGSTSQRVINHLERHVEFVDEVCRWN